MDAVGTAGSAAGTQVIFRSMIIRSSP
jgi:hypothetical protein